MKTSQLKLSVALLCFVCKFSARGNPCELDDYKDLNEGDRSEGYKDATDKCDSDDLADEWNYWYKVSGNAGNALATNNAPKEGSCGTTDRLYLKDTHPAYSNGEVTKKVCVARGKTACEREIDIQVINCGAFYLYKLVDLGDCTGDPWRYCTNGEEHVTCEGVSCSGGLQCALKNGGKQTECVSASVDPCATNPCQNGATCHKDNSGGFTCSCASGYTGNDCGTSSTSQQQSSTIQDESPQTPVEQQQSVGSSAQAQITTQQTVAVHSITTTQAQQQQQQSVVTTTTQAQITTQEQQQQSVESSAQAQITTQQTAAVPPTAAVYSITTTQAQQEQQQSVVTTTTQVQITTQVQQQQSVESSAQAQITTQQTAAVPPTAAVHSITTTQVQQQQQQSVVAITQVQITTQEQQQQSVESSAQAQITTQQTAAVPPTAAVHSITTTQAQQQKQQSVVTTTQVQITTQEQQQQSVESSAQAQITTQQTAAVPLTAAVHSITTTQAQQQQQQSVATTTQVQITTQVQQQQSVESSAQAQITTQQTAAVPLTAAVYSITTTQAQQQQQQSVATTTEAQITTQEQQQQSVESLAQAQIMTQQTAAVPSTAAVYSITTTQAQQQQQQSVATTTTQAQITTQEQQQQSVESSAQAPITTQQTVAEPSSVESPASQQHSIMTAPTQQQQSLETSQQAQMTTEQTAAEPSSVELLSQFSQQHSSMTSQALQTSYPQQQQTLVQSLHSQVQPSQQPSVPHSHSQSQQETLHLSVQSTQQQFQTSMQISQQETTQHTANSVGESTKQSNNTQQDLLNPIQPTPSLQASAHVNGSTIVPVHGNWSSWSPWPNCNKPCNGGVKIRKRLCDNPEPAFGGKNCDGPANETENCNLDSCPADEINYQVRFKDKHWRSDLANPESQLYKEVEEEIQQMIVTFYNNNGEGVTVKVLNLRNGSIIASFNVSYPSIDSLQIVVLQEEIAGGTLGTSSAELLNITSNYVPNEAPVILESISTTSTTIELKWSEVTQLYSAPLLGYVIVYKEIYKKFHVDALISVAPTPREAVLEDLKKFTNYTIRVYAFTRNGNGVSSKPISLKTQEDVPSESPPNTIVKATSSSTIEVRWRPINQAYVHGILLGYEVRYAKYDEIPLTWETMALEKDTRNIVLRDLAKFSPYKVVLCAKTSKGCGKEYSAIVRTWDDVPSMPPQSVTAQNLTSESFIDVTWSPVPEGHVNGILLGYSIKYQRILTADWEVFDTEEHALTVLPTDLAYTLRVQTYSTYWIQVAAFTRKGMGPYSQVYAETCRCPNVLYTNYWSTSPYLKINEKDQKLEGIFSGLVTNMIHTACGICPGHGGDGHTIIDIISNGKEKSSAKKSVLEVLNDIDEVPQISFPIYGNKYITRYLADYAYINLVDSPGVAFIATKKPPGSAAMNMINAVMDCVPMIVLSACMAYISGFAIWALDSKHNPEEFPPSFIKGVGEGFWWSFISMTTVGYGDRSPRSIPARIFGIMWTLTGLVIISILIGAIASSLTSVTVEQSIMLYGLKIGAIQDSVEHRLGILKNAKVNEESSYRNVEEIRAALEDGEIDGALLDTYVAAEHKETLFDEKTFVKKILDRPFGYGVVLSGVAVNVEQRCRDYIDLKISEIFNIIQNMTKTLDAQTGGVEQSTGLFDSSSEMFRMSMISLLGILGVAVCIGLAYQYLFFVPRRNKVSEKELKSSTSKLAYKEALITEMKEFVDAFYSEMTKKISSIKKEQRREIRDKKQMKKYWNLASKFAELFKKCSKNVENSSVTVSSWASEKQYELHKQITHLVSESRSQKQDQDWELPNTPDPIPAARDSSSFGNACVTRAFTNSTISASDVQYKESSC